MKSTLHLLAAAFLTLALSCPASALSVLKISPNSTVRSGSEVEADYTTTHLYIDEIAGDSIPVTIFFDPGTTGVESAEVFTNLNRRDRADDDANSDGIQDGILPPDGNTIPAGNEDNYFMAHTMIPVSGGYQITLHAEKTGAYRLTARFRLSGDAPGTYRYYNSGGKRDHSLVISPKVSRNIRLYEVNTLNIEASGTQFSQRSTFEDLSDRPGAIHTASSRKNQWNLDYIKGLGINWLWFQPYHPYGWEGRHESSANINARQPGAGSTTWLWNGGSPYEDVNYGFGLGSPYAVKNFWEIDSRMTASFAGDPNNIADVGSQANRDKAMLAFRNFVTDADTAGVNIMPDAAFNHTAWDVELGEPGIATNSGNPSASWMAAQGASGWAKTNLIHDREVRVFSRAGDYRKRASYYNTFFDNDIAPGPDRTDFGKWLDVTDVFFGRYAALVGAQDGSEQTRYQTDLEWIDYTAYEYGSNSSDPNGGGSFDAFTRATWHYFGQYASYWLGKTRPAGENMNSADWISLGNSLTDEQRYSWDAKGIDGLRCDFGQGLPPQAWEYIINVARSYKWSFVFMAETLDDGAPAARSNRQFDILNETIFRSLRNAGNANDFKSAFESRRNLLGQGMVLLNTVSHDEDNLVNPWDAVTKYAVSSTQDGVPMIFPGQELGISQFFGYDLMEKNFGKYIPHFKTYNSMMPLWNDANFGNDQLYQVYSAINAARGSSPALRSSNRWFLNGDEGDDKIFAVAKYEQPNASPAFKDVVLAFANVDRGNTHDDDFTVPAALASLIGIKDGRTYNVKNIAAYTAQQSDRRDLWLWGGGGITGSALKSSGFYVKLHKVPVQNSAWIDEPYEAQYLKLYDVTPPPSPAPQANYYSLGDQGVFTWTSNAGPDDNVTSYSVVVKNGTGATVTSGTVTDGSNQFAFTGTPGTVYYATVTATNVAGINSTTPASSDAGAPNPASATTPVKLLQPLLDDDGDGQSNGAEDTAGTNPLSSSSSLKTTSTAISGSNVIITVATVAGKKYRLETSTLLTSLSWSEVGDEITATGPSTVFTAPGGAGQPKRFYRVRVIP